MTEPYDLVIRGGTVATASEVFKADIGIRGGRIVALATDLPRQGEEIDATGKLVLPGGVDAHCHFDQPTSDGSRMADDFSTGPLSAAFFRTAFTSSTLVARSTSNTQSVNDAFSNGTRTACPFRRPASSG